MDSFPNFLDINSQVPSLSSLLSCPSEPPDVGNWLSSYEYRSPIPDSNFSFQDSVFRVPESLVDAERVEEEEEEKAKFEKIDEVVAAEKLVKCRSTCVEYDKHNENLSLDKSVDSVGSSLLSEPQDLGNWFSSYNYDSSVFDTSNILRDVISEENGCQEERSNVEVINEDEGRSDSDSENAPLKPKGFAEHNSSSDKNIRAVQPSSKGDGSVKKKITNLTTANTSILGRKLQPRKQDNILQQNPGQTKYKETLSLVRGSPRCNGETHMIQLDTDRSPDNNYMRSQKLSRKNEEEKSKAKVQHDKLDMSADLAKSSSERISTCTSNKENDGFVTTRKNGSTRASGESSWKKPEEMLFQCSTNAGTVPLACDRNMVMKRKALTETTNLKQSNGIEITGKWKCPRKGKPNLGPPMKQVRLDRWVHRV
ncbi:hypothetical protein RIF29_36836 [Crotalaria pallida]|uniref:Uncharacterized protein n=1 Tax=Crotalaria pallida TaxID=3830 RepID=A0AAN9HVZ9_CROPI